MGLLECFGVRSKPEIYYYNTRFGFHPQVLAGKLEELIKKELEKGKKGVVFLCIGTDRSTGDSLGPLIGHKLQEREKRRGSRRRAAIFGTLERPVHAMNLEQYQEFVARNFPDRVLIAVDASIGSSEHVGYVTVGKGALKPGLGVSKDLCEVGDIFITGIVGGSGNFDPVMLQSVRLSVVMRMADCICESISLVENLWDFSSAV
ncbi:MAG: spore protease YyaC [Lachnospiraceae bacterium]|nr:spore protease YyaC [Lachnospiraceae bacterium]MDO5549626.1 spore protease YyaC [Lachnospiraceae bacterium]